MVVEKPEDGYKLSKEARFRNTEQRIEKIESFTAETKFPSVNGERQVSLQFSEPIICKKSLLNGLDEIIGDMVRQYGGAAIHHLDWKMTSVLREALMTCHALFEDEIDNDRVEYYEDDEYVFFGEDEEVDFCKESYD